MQNSFYTIKHNDTEWTEVEFVAGFGWMVRYRFESSQFGPMTQRTVFVR